VSYDRATCEVEIDWSVSGSVLRGDVAAHCSSVRAALRVESSASADEVGALVAMARSGCFMEQLVTTAVPMATTLTVNDDVIPIPDHPAARGQRRG